MPRRPRNPSGFVRERKTKAGRSWQAIVKYPDPDKPGVWQQRSASFERKAEAQAWVDATLTEHRGKPNYRPPSGETLGEYMYRWYAVMQGRVSPNTMRSYRQMGKHAIDALGGKRLTDLGTLDLQGLCGSLLERGLSVRTVCYVHGVVKQALKDAEDWGLIQSNPARKVKPPRLERRELKIPTPEESAMLLQSTVGLRLYPLWAWLSLTGTRKGEALGLRWSDIDWNAGSATIQRTFGGQLGPTKTANSTRTISLAPHLLELLKRRRHDQRLERLAAGSAWKESGLVFTTRVGTPIGPRNASRDFKLALRQAGLALTYRIHDLRHAMATHWLVSGVPVKVVSERLGHASVAFTLQVYGHVLPGQQAAAAEAMEQDLFSRVTISSPRADENGEPG